MDLISKVMMKSVSVLVETCRFNSLFIDMGAFEHLQCKSSRHSIYIHLDCILEDKQGCLRL